MPESEPRRPKTFHRRGFLFGITTLLPALSVLAAGRTVFVKKRSLEPSWNILSPIPGGKIELKASTQEYESSKAILEVRYSANDATEACEATLRNEVCEATLEKGACTLTPDLPSKKWRPGKYEARIRIINGSEKTLWLSSWQHAFSLRPWPWLG